MNKKPTDAEVTVGLFAVVFYAAFVVAGGFALVNLSIWLSIPTEVAAPGYLAFIFWFFGRYLTKALARLEAKRLLTASGLSIQDTSTPIEEGTNGHIPRPRQEVHRAASEL